MGCSHNNQVGECLENPTDCYPQSRGCKICYYSSGLEKWCIYEKVLKYDLSFNDTSLPSHLFLCYLFPDSGLYLFSFWHIHIFKNNIQSYVYKS